MIDAGHEGPREQHNHSSGTFIGRDNYGPIRYELLDPKTRTTLAKLSKDAPALATVLKKALHDGVISPNAVAALESAVRSINMDVAEALMLAGRNINADVAECLMDAGHNINEDVANKFVQVKDELSSTAHELDLILHSLHATAEQVNSLRGGSDLRYQFGPPGGGVTGTVQRSPQVVTRPSPKSIDNWKLRFKLILWSFGAGLLTGVILIYSLVKQ